MNRRSFLKKMLGSFLTFVGLGGGSYYYAREIEPTLLHIQRETISSPKVPTSFNGFTIVQFSDTHIGFQYTLDQLKKLVAKINEIKPDLIVFTGDLVDEPNKYKWNNELVNLLATLTAPQGKYWVYGNHDHGGYGTEIVKNVMEQADFKLLKNSHTTIENQTDRIIVAGIDDVMLGKPDLNLALKNSNPDLFAILLSHEPDYANTTKAFPVDLQLSGHSHGGQVRLPFIGHVYTPAFAEEYVQGRYELSKDLTLLVSKGIGTTRVPYRFLCKPEIQVITLNGM
ncbi:MULTISPECIES: metallophosphoesterase [unclassified Virgibacillus]|uniref:metallophosphoesterase n=1 Tax=unclassified Virgibacillus TaxID=2620237 RepID=UPI0024DEBBDF|nr:metallophosphoesterase [Virgibacillus sp. LDC-1]